MKNDSYFVVDVVTKAATGKQKILVLLDGDDGVNIDDCASLSRQLGHYLEENEVLAHAYILEVSSPGLDHPIKLPRQFKKNIGRNFKLVLKDGDIIKGQLKEMDGETLVIGLEPPKKKDKTAPTETRVAMSKIEKANVLVSFK